MVPLLPLACASGPLSPEPNDLNVAARAGVGGSGSGSAGRGTTGGSAGSVNPPQAGGSAGSSAASGGAGSVGGASASGGTGGDVFASGGLGAIGSGGVDSGTGGAGVGGSVGGVGGAGGMEIIGSGGMIAQGGMVTDPCAGVTCGADQTCNNGSCVCMTGMLCSSTCVDVDSDLNNCGACGTKCDASGSCVSGKCVVPNCMPDTQTRNGHITNYTLATPMVACHYQTSTLPQYYGAMNEYDWNSAGVCGACVEITNGGNKLVVQIVDQCPYKGNEQWCFSGSHHVDLNPAAYGALGANNNPAVSWKFVPCNVSNNMKYYFDEASQKYYLAVTPMNHKNPMAKMEVKKADGTWAAMERSTYNMFVLDGGNGSEGNTFTFRLTDIYNHVVTDTVTMSAGQTVNGNVQFAACP